MTTCPQLTHFLDGLRLAIVNVSVSPSDPSRELFRTLLRRGTNVVPIRPGVSEIEGQHVYARLQDVPLQLAGAILLVQPLLLERFIAECSDARIPEVWIDAGQHPHPAEAIARFSRRGIHVVSIADLISEGRPRRRRARETARWLGDVLGLRSAG